MSDPSDLLSAALSPTRRFFFEYGYFLDAFTGFETMLEVFLRDELRLSNEEASITFASIGFGAKISILYSLLARDSSNAVKIEQLKKTAASAGRNAFAHGFVIEENDGRHQFVLVRRQVKNKYSATVRVWCHEDMEKHASEFYNNIHKTLKLFGITLEDVVAYQKYIVDNAPKSEGLANEPPPE